MEYSTDISYSLQDTAVIGSNGERYEFLTREVALAFLCILQKNRPFSSWSNCVIGFHAVGSTASLTIQSYWKLGDRQVLILDQNNRVVKLDLLYIVACWLRTSTLAKLAKAIWYGQRAIK